MGQMREDPAGGTFIREARDHDGDLLPNGLRMPSYIVMKRGQSMQEWIRSKQPPPLMGLWMLGELAGQIKVLHTHGLVHRDIKCAVLGHKAFDKAACRLRVCHLAAPRAQLAPLPANLPHVAFRPPYPFLESE